jgi:hypothetical protein
MRVTCSRWPAASFTQSVTPQVPVRNGHCTGMVGPPISLRPFPTIGRGTKPAFSLPLEAGFSLQRTRMAAVPGSDRRP